MKDNSFVVYVLDQLAPIGNIRSRKMFGGYGIYKDDIFFALVADDVLYFKVDESNRLLFEAHGSKPFTYVGKEGKPTSLNYWEVPADVLENTEILSTWVAAALAVAMNAKKAKIAKKQKR